jgi:hypothetical protein
VKLEGTYTFDAPREVVWQALLDPEILAKAMPGGEKLEQTGDNEYKAKLKIKVGPVQGQFEGTVALSDINAPHSYRMHVDGKGAPGFMKGEGEVHLEEQNGSTLMHYSGEAQVGGRIASVGQRLLDSSAKALTRQSLEALHQQIKARTQAQHTDEPPPEVEAPSQTQFAAGVAKQVLDDLISHEQRMLLLAGGLGILALVLILNWWMDRLAERVADRVWERR